MADICDGKSACFREIILYLYVGRMEEHSGKEEIKRDTENKKKNRRVSLQKTKFESNVLLDTFVTYLR